MKTFLVHIYLQFARSAKKTKQEYYQQSWFGWYKVYIINQHPDLGNVKVNFVVGPQTLCYFWTKAECWCVDQYSYRYCEVLIQSCVLFCWKVRYHPIRDIFSMQTINCSIVVVLRVIWWLYKQKLQMTASSLLSPLILWLGVIAFEPSETPRI